MFQQDRLFEIEARRLMRAIYDAENDSRETSIVTRTHDRDVLADIVSDGYRRPHRTVEEIDMHTWQGRFTWHRRLLRTWIRRTFGR